MSPTDAGRVTDTATSLVTDTATSLAALADALARLASPSSDEVDVANLELRPPRKAGQPMYNDPSNYLG